MDSSILFSMSENVTSDLPYICLAPPAEGYTIALSVADEGMRVLVFAQEHLQPEQYRGLNDRMTVVDADLETELGFHSALEAITEVYDAIFFIGELDRFSNEAVPTELEEELLNVHLRLLLSLRGRFMTIYPSGTPIDSFPTNPLKTKFLDGEAPAH